jgi:hypothetical protein
MREAGGPSTECRYQRVCARSNGGSHGCTSEGPAQRLAPWRKAKAALTRIRTSAACSKEGGRVLQGGGDAPALGLLYAAPKVSASAFVTYRTTSSRTYCISCSKSGGPRPRYVKPRPDYYSTCCSGDRGRARTPPSLRPSRDRPRAGLALSSHRYRRRACGAWRGRSQRPGCARS